MKGKSSKLLAVVVTISMLLTMISVQPILAKAPEATPAATVAGEIEGATEPAIYLIRLADPPLTSYRGGIAGLEATSTEGQAKLDTKSPSSLAYRQYLADKQAGFIASMEQTFGRSIEVVHQYAIANNGLAAWLTPAEAEAVAQMPGVIFVQRDYERELQTDSSVPFLGAPGIWDGSQTGGLPGTMGEGMIVGVIDTGVSWLNPSFAEVGPVDAYVHTNPFGAGVYVGNCDPLSPNYQDICNDKLIGAYGYPGNGNDARDYHGHGSHTSSTAAGNFVAITDPVTVTIQGMAPHANIIAYASCCAGSDLAASIDDAINDGVDAINYSIGSSSPSDVWNDFDSVGYLNAREAGIFVATSAGNDGPGPETVGSPADAPWLTAAGNNLHVRVYANLGSVTGPTPVPAELEDIAIVKGADGPDIVAPVENDIVWAGDVDPGNELGCNAFPANAFDDAIALIQRGDCTFATKETNASDAGAIAMIVFNHSAGPPIVMGGAGSIITSVFMSKSDGEAVVAWIQANPGLATFRIDPGIGRGDNPAWANIIASGSSRGANRALPDIVKPDVTAFGTDVLAVDATYDDIAWNFMSGTSMASPHIAGAATLLMALHPDWTPAQVQSALMTTGWTDMLKEDGLTPADPFDIGAGRIQLGPAAQAGLLLDESIANYWAADPALGGDPKTLNLPSVGNGSCVGTCTWERTVESTLPVAQAWEVTVTAPPTITLEVSPANFVLGAGMTQTIVISADVTGAPLDEWFFGEVVISPTVMAAAPAAPEAVLLTEGFEGAWPPTGWASYAISGTEFLTGTTGTTGSHGDPYSGMYFAWHNDEFGAQDVWLVTSQITPELDLTTLTFWQRDYWQTYYEYHGVWVSTGSPDPSDGDFVEVWTADTTDTWNETSVDLSAYTGTPIYVAFHYTGDFMDEWYLDDVMIESVEVETVAPPAHLPVAVRPGSSSLPDVVEIVTDQYAGTQTEAGIQVLDDITDLTIENFGLTLADRYEADLMQDPTNGNAYDNLDDVLWFTTDVPDGALRLVAEVIKSEAPDLDLFVGTGDTPSAATEVCVSAGGSWTEYCNIDDPAAGTWWVLVQNWSGSADQPDHVVAVAAAVDDVDNGNMTVTGPAAVPAGDPFDLDVNWNEPSMVGQDRWYGAFSVGTDAGNPGNVGMVGVNLEFVGVRLTKTGPDMANTGDTIGYAITFEAPGPIAGTAMMTDVLPAGVMYIADSVTATYGTAWYDAGDNAVYWSNGVPGTEAAVAAAPTGSGSPVALTLESTPAEGPTVAAPAPLSPDAAVSLILDDGVNENNIGIGGTWEFIYANYFSPDAANFPFDLNEIQVYFEGGTTAVNVGDDLLLVVYEDADGDPANGADWLASYPATVQALDAWNVYPLATPVSFAAPTNVFIGVVALEVPGSSYFPAALDQTATQQRSWAGWWLTSPPPTPPTLPPDDTWTLIDAFFPGNWLLRGYGESMAVEEVTISFDMTVTAACSETVLNVADLNYNGDMFSADTAFTTQPCCELVDGANFEFAPASPFVGDTVMFTGSVAAGDLPIDYTWNFGDESMMDMGMYVTHTYATTGTYTVWMTATNCGGEGTSVISDTITVAEMPTEMYYIYLPIIIVND